MTEKELLLQAASVPTQYFDGFTCYRKLNGVLRCVGYVIETGAQLNLVVSLSGAEQANRATRLILDGKPVPKLWNGTHFH